MADEGSAKYPGIRITAVDTFLVEGNCCFVKISTNEGITGLGEGSISDNKVGTIAQCIKDLEGHLIGKNPTDIELLWQGLYRWNRWHVGRALQHRPQRHRYRPVGYPRKDRGPADLQAPRRRRAGQGPHLRRRQREVGRAARPEHGMQCRQDGAAGDQNRRPSHRSHAMGPEPGSPADRGDAGRRGR